ncbi:MAG: hypothetical protein C0167_01790 [Nitrososphaera sp.]|nr:MAG: hypothetical protein C0167_01790 [Nitrososphaera sp.]
MCREACIKVRLVEGFDLGHLHEIFIEHSYGHQFSGTVIDVGASNADSSIFFALNGASRVIALEPDPESFALAMDNVTMNDLQDRITLVNAALAADDGYAELLRPAASPNASSLNPVDGVQHIVNFDGAVRVKVKKISLPTLMGGIWD